MTWSLLLSPAALIEALTVVDRVASTVGMKLGLRRCRVAHMQKGRFTDPWKLTRKDTLGHPHCTCKETVACRHPYVLLQYKRNRRLYILEMAVAWASLQVENELRSCPRRGTFVPTEETVPGYCLDVVPVVITPITHYLVGDLGRLPTKTESQIGGMQHSVLCSSMRILRSHLSASELAAWTHAGSAVSHRPARSASLPA